MKEEDIKVLPTTNKKMPTSLNVLIWVIVGTILFLVFWFVIKPEIGRQQVIAKSETEKKCYQIQGLDYAPPKYKCLVNYTSSIICKTRDTKENPQYTAFASCMGQEGYKDY